MAASARALLFSRFNGQDLFRLSLKPSTSLSPRHLLRPFPPRREPLHNSPSSSSSVVLSCLLSGVDGGGVADDFVSTRKATFRREFSVLANVLKQIEPLDTSIIADGVSSPAKDSMKRTISTMLGLLPSDQLTVTIRLSKQPLDHLLVSSIITGYTLWNAEYRVSLMRNLDVSPGIPEVPVSYSGRDVASKECEVGDGAATVGCISSEEAERRVPQSIGNLPPEALNYIRELESELAAVEKELDTQKQENMDLESKGEEKNDLLEYLRSLEPYMVTELSRPSTLEVEEIIQQLVQNILQKFYGDDTASGFLEDSSVGKTEEFVDSDEYAHTIETSRDYLAKLLFWCVVKAYVISLYSIAEVELDMWLPCIQLDCRSHPAFTAALNARVVPTAVTLSNIIYAKVYVVGSSHERLGIQTAPKLCGWSIVERERRGEEGCIFFFFFFFLSGNSVTKSKVSAEATSVEWNHRLCLLSE
ncbi:hypothetical protein ACLOJK_030963 [Asimina triloba]